MMKQNVFFALLCSAALLTACGTQTADSADMQYIKTSVMYDTITDMYQNPEQYLGKSFHMVGVLYPSEDDEGAVIYSVYTSDADGDAGIGLELDWEDFSGLEDYDTITVEGTLDKEKGTYQGEQIEYLVLRVTMLEKRAV